MRNGWAWQESWNRQQEAFIPDREQRFAAMVDAVAAITEDDAPRVLDLAGGTGTITLRVLDRFPEAAATVLDQDPVLLTIASATIGLRASIVDADLSTPEWRSHLPSDEYDAVLTATALHWLPGDRVAGLYGEIREVLRPGGIFVNADHMEDETMPKMTGLLKEHARSVREDRYAAGAATGWQEWWRLAGEDPVLGPKAAERELIYPATRHGHEWVPPAGWHVGALRAVGFAEAGILWRNGPDAAVVGVR